MFFEKIKYSKCPNCKKHGISSFCKTGYKYSPKLVCKCCGTKYRVNFALSSIIKLFIAFLIGIIANIFNRYVYEIPFWIWIVLGLFLLGLYEYFTPLEKSSE